MFYIAGISIALFIAALLISKKEKSTSDYILFAWMLLNALHLSLFYTKYTGLMLEQPIYFTLMLPLPLMHGIFLYYYVAAVTNQLPSKKWILIIHLIPLLLVYIYLIPNFILLPREDQIKLFQSHGQGQEIFMMTLLTAVIISGIFYVTLSLLLIKKHKKNILERFSDVEEINLRWLQFLIYGLGGIWALIILTQEDNYIFMGVTIFVILIGFFGVQQIDIFRKPRKTIPLKDTKEKYAKSGLTEESSSSLYQELLNIVEKETLYKESEISIGELASRLNTHPNYLSQVINENSGKNFYDFINTYRIDEFKTLISDPNNRKFTIIALAYECGFNSKSAFNRYFKKVMHKTPSEYMKEMG